MTKKTLNISSKTIVLFLAIGLVAALGTSFVISSMLSKAVSAEVSSRDLALIFGAIESGPLAIARLHSGAIAQQELVRLMSHAELSDRGLISVEILGGEHFAFNYAEWRADSLASPDCRAEITKHFQIPDSINPFMVRVFVDRCHKLKEQTLILKYSSIASVLVATCAMILIMLAGWPAISSIQKAEMVLNGDNSVEGNEIIFRPVRELVIKAQENLVMERQVAVVNIANQVSHDIRSPISALNMVISTLGGVSADKLEIIRLATTRINGIADQLLVESKKVSTRSLAPKVKSGSSNVQDLIREIVNEKRSEFAHRLNLKIEMDLELGKSAIIDIDDNSLKRILSNLINNSVEATDDMGVVHISLTFKLERVIITIIDDGRGIPTELLHKVGSYGFSYGKSGNGSGAGIGVFYAKKLIEQSGGSFSIKSGLNKGTTVSISFQMLPR